MKTNIFAITFVTFSAVGLQARVPEFRYQQADGVFKCINRAGKVGYNPGYLGGCGQVSGKKISSSALNQSIGGLQSIGTEYTSPDFSGSSLVGCNFTKASMDLADLKSALIQKSKFDHAQITRCNAKASMVVQASFVETNLAHSKWAGSSINQSRYDRAKLRASDFASSLMTDVSFQSSDLRASNFENSSLTDVNFTNADLRGANFSKTLLSSVTWTGAKYDSATKLPFSDAKAAQYKMVKQ